MSVLSDLESSDDPAVRQGLATRRSVLGEAYVSRTLERPAEPGDDQQHLLTGQVWGTLWNREALDRRSRSLVTIALLVAGGHGDELEAHVLGGLRNGLTPEEITEVVIHSGAYCGAPVGLAGMRRVKAALAREAATA